MTVLIAYLDMLLLYSGDEFPFILQLYRSSAHSEVPT
jgi:hypothetical protein